MSDISSYGEFWPYYLKQHSKPACRALHYVGTTVAVTCLGFLVATGDSWWVPGVLFGGYAFAWIGHFLIEGNRPATFRYPLWSLFSDLRMIVLAIAGRLPKEPRSAEIRGRGPTCDRSRDVKL